MKNVRGALIFEDGPRCNSMSKETLDAEAVCEECRKIFMERADNEIAELRRQLAESERMRLAYKRALEGTGCAWDVGNRRGGR